jgi:hypothetical protein
MRRPLLLCLPTVLAACSVGSDNNQQASAARYASEAREPAAIKSARMACKPLREPTRKYQDLDVGISDYEACLAKQANRTQPANPQLCSLAKSTMSANGTCTLAE